MCAAQLGTEGRAFAGAARNADRLKRGNNVIDAEASSRIATENAQGKDLFDRLKNTQGPVADILNRAAVRLAKANLSGENPNVVKSDALTEFQQSIPDLVRGGTNGNRTGGAGFAATPVDTGGSPEPAGGAAGDLFGGDPLPSEAGGSPEGGAPGGDGGAVHPQPAEVAPPAEATGPEASGPEVARPPAAPRPSSVTLQAALIP